MQGDPSLFASPLTPTSTPSPNEENGKVSPPLAVSQKEGFVSPIQAFSLKSVRIQI